MGIAGWAPRDGRRRVGIAGFTAGYVLAAGPSGLRIAVLALHG
ncbi:hypothetical protein [Actinomycetospora cinnamomea]|uniref:Uncharacterized protein n=1 Tax=Actinomycetospora cinnamomea TaxID=663609 RepID=A0A2U1FG41_9PSEU|nr:hypothetical protein [Actinomycetospora cinnamomea]PVZ11128.1 hypothetical protein C8D89_104342 [Actinomycetospora cinnamomea]